MKTKIMDTNSMYYGLEPRLLMENAGHGLASVIESTFGKNNEIAVFCGLGNNGGDGFVAARFLSKENTVDLFLVGDEKEIKTKIARENWKLLDFSSCSTHNFDFQDIKCDIVVDALLGVGIMGKLREPIRSVVEYINGLGEKGAKIVSVDLPTGHGTSLSVNADLTVSMQEKKTENALVVDLGIPERIKHLTGPGDAKYLKRRKKDSHKGDNGRVLVVGGSERYHGAPIYTAAAASTLVDLVYVASPAANVIKHYSPDFIVTEDILEYTYDSSVIGVGMGMREDALNIMESLERKVIDADGLKMLAENLDLAEGSILTPHRGEFARLFGELPDTLEARIERVREMAAAYDCTILLKGKVDIIADTDRYKLNYTGNEGMTTGGTGDLLAGLAAGFFSQNEAFQSACAASFVNGYAGDLVYADRGVFYTASDVLYRIPEALVFCNTFGE